VSTDFIALFDASSPDLDAEWLLEKLAVHPAALWEVQERYWHLWRPKAWAIEMWPSSTQPQLVGPGGFAMHFKPRTLELYHTMRFKHFTGLLSSRNALRRACLFIADSVGSGRAIYTHELMPCDGEGLEQIEAGLRQRFGPPATTFEELHAAEFFGSRAWYIDTFIDLRTGQRTE
jgi:hypothetical protein